MQFKNLSKMKKEESKEKFHGQGKCVRVSISRDFMRKEKERKKVCSVERKGDKKRRAGG